MERESDERDSGTRPRPGLVARLEDTGPVRALLLTGALLGALAAVVAAVTWTVGAARDVSDPHRAQYAALEQLDLDVRLEYFEESFGVARSVVDLCAEQVLDCADEPDADVSLYLHETPEVVVRAVFQGNSLELYTVTTMTAEFRPPVRWLGSEFGDLGEFTTADAMSTLNGIEPTDVSVFMGPQSSSYADVLAAGAPGGDRGLVLGLAPAGFGGPPLTFDGEAGQRIALATSAQDVPDAVVRFREGTTPNTYGEFRDDGGFVSRVAADADVVRRLLHVGTEV